MGKASVERAPGGRAEPQGVYGQLSKQGAALNIAFSIDELPSVPGYYAVQAYYIGLGGDYRMVHFCVAVSGEASISIRPHNSIAKSFGPQYVPLSSSYGQSNNFFSCTASGGLVKITVESEALSANWAVKEVDENSFVRAIPIGLS